MTWDESNRIEWYLHHIKCFMLVFCTIKLSIVLFEDNKMFTFDAIISLSLFSFICGSHSSQSQSYWVCMSRWYESFAFFVQWIRRIRPTFHSENQTINMMNENSNVCNGHSQWQFTQLVLCVVLYSINNFPCEEKSNEICQRIWNSGFDMARSEMRKFFSQRKR